MKILWAIVSASALVLAGGSLHAENVAGINSVGTGPSRDGTGSSRVLSLYKNAAGEDVYETTEGTFVQLPQNVVEAPGPGWPSRAEFAARGILFVDRTSGDSVRQVAPHRYELQYSSSSGQRIVVEAETGGLIEPSVDVTVSSRGDVLKYVYTFTSASGSEQSIQAISIDLSSGGPVLDGTDESGWALGRVGMQAQDSSDARATWLPIGSTPLLAPEAAARGLTISSKDWPALTDAIFLSHPSRAFVPEATAELPERVERFLLDRDRLDSDVRRVTVGPRIAPPARTAEGRRAVVRHLMADAGKAEAAGLADVAAAALIRGILEQAEANVESPQAFTDLAGKIDGAVGASPTYRQSVSWVLRALGSPSDAPPDGGRHG